MKNLKEVSQSERDYVRLSVGSSKTYLGAIRLHKLYLPVFNELDHAVGGVYSRELKVLLNSVMRSLKDGDSGTALTRNQKHYESINKELKLTRGKCVSYKRMCSLLDSLEGLGLVNTYVGYKDVRSDESMTSCILFTKKLVGLFESVSLKHIAKDMRRFVEVRDDYKNVMKGVRGIRPLEKPVKELTEWINSHDITFGVVSKKIRLQRVFRYTLSMSGRLYFGALQTLKSFKRKLIRINDEPCTECDYSSQHLRLCASLEGIVLPKDFKPYEVDVSDLIVAKVGYEGNIRVLIKFGIMMLLNSGNASASLRSAWLKASDAITEAIQKGDWEKAKNNPFYGVSGIKNASKVIKRIRAYNSYAEKYFTTKGGSWGELQNIDSEIIMNVLLRLKAQKVCALPYHDSAVVQSKHQQLLITAMEDAWEDVVGLKENAVIDVKWDMSK